MGNITLQDVAKELGVSTTTVSDILQRGHHHRYRAQTVEKVHAAASRMGYQAHAAARMLRQTAPSLIGIAVRTEIMGRLSVNNLVVAVETELESRNLQTVLINPAQMVPAKSYTPFPSPDLVAGIISADLAMEYCVPDFYRVLATKVPLVSLYPMRSSNIDYVTTDRIRAVELAVEHLVTLGHKRIAFAEARDRDSIPGAMKIRGWQRAHKKYRLDPNPAYVIPFSTQSLIPQMGAEILEALCNTHPRPTAVICNSDDIAMCVIAGLTRKGFQLPCDLSIIGFNGSAYAEFIYPTLTTIAQPIAEIAKTAVDRLLYLIEAYRKDLPVQPEQKLIEPTLLLRESTAAPHEPSERI